MEKFNLTGKFAIVTGAARGLGFNMARALAEAGVSGLALLDVQDSLGLKAAQTIKEETGVDTEFIHVDVSDSESVSAGVNAVLTHFGAINIVIHAAGIAHSNVPAEDYTDVSFQRMMAINLSGTFHINRSAGRAMLAAGIPGSIINIASMSSLIVNYPNEQCAYNASKAGVIQLTKSLAAEWATRGIRVNAISPGYMDTELNRDPQLDGQKVIWKERTPMGRLGREDELNGLAVYLAGEGSSFMTGANVVIDGGYTLW